MTEIFFDHLPFPLEIRRFYGPDTVGGAWAFRPPFVFADDAATVPAGDGDPVALVRDLSGLGTDLVQPNAAARPILRTDGNGIWWIEGDGTRSFDVVPSTTVRTVAAAIAPATVASPTNVYDYGIPPAGAPQVYLRTLPGNVLRFSPLSLLRLADRTIVLDPTTTVLDDDIQISYVPDEPVVTFQVTAAAFNGELRVFSDSNGGSQFVGKLYGFVSTSERVPETMRDRIVDWLAGLAGHDLP